MGGKICLGRLFFPIHCVYKSKQLGNGYVDVRRYLFFNIQLGKHLDKIRIVLYRDTMVLGDFDDPFRNSTGPFGSHPGGAVFVRPISQGNGFFSMIFCLSYQSNPLRIQSLFMNLPPASLKAQRTQRGFSFNFLLSPAKEQRDVNKGRKSEFRSPPIRSPQRIFR